MAKLTKKQIGELIPLMEEAYPDAKCALDYDTPFHLLCAVMLSAQTTDVSVNRVTPGLFARFPEAKDIAAAPLEELEACIRTIGLYRSKAAHLRETARILAADFNGEVPADYNILVTLPGVGRKTANVVLAEAFGENRIAVDTHVFRLANRMGLTAEKDVLATEKALMKALPEEHWVRMHHSLIFHGRQVCHAKKPACESCPVSGFCKKNF